MTDTDIQSRPPTASDLAASVRDAGGAARDQITESARSALDDARSAAADKTGEIKDVALGEIDRTAKGLEAAAAELQGSPFQQDLLHEAAEGLKQISRAMEGKSIGTMVEDLADFGRRNPLAYLGGAALAGFALARFARASAEVGGADARDWSSDNRSWDQGRTEAGASAGGSDHLRPTADVTGGYGNG